jgi:hypothetical protein
VAALAVVAAVGLAGCGSAKTAGSKVASRGGSTSTTTVAGSSTSTTTVVPTLPLPTATTAAPGAPASTTVTTIAKPKTTTPTTVVTTTSTPVGGVGSVIQLTSANSGTVPVALGQTVELTLSDPGIVWGQLMLSVDGFLAPDPSPSPPANGQLAVWTAVETGSVTITSTGSPQCTPGVQVACPDFVRLFTVTLVIS